MTWSCLPSHFLSMTLETGQFLFQHTVLLSTHYIEQENEPCNSWGAQGVKNGKEKKAEMTTCHILWHKDNGRETWLSNPHQNSWSTWPWNRVCALGTLNKPQKMYNDWIMNAGWKKKKNQTDHQQLLTTLVQTSKQERCTFHTMICIPTNWRLQPLLKHEEKLENRNTSQKSLFSRKAHTLMLCNDTRYV